MYGGTLGAAEVSDSIADCSRKQCSQTLPRPPARSRVCLARVGRFAGALEGMARALMVCGLDVLIGGLHHRDGGGDGCIDALGVTDFERTPAARICLACPKNGMINPESWTYLFFRIRGT
jgi:hypothetical protein